MKVYPLKIRNQPKWIKSVYIPELQKLVLYSFYASTEIKDIKFDKIKENNLIDFPEDIARKEGISSAFVRKPKKISDNYITLAEVVSNLAKEFWPEHPGLRKNGVSGIDAYIPECMKQKISQ